MTKKKKVLLSRSSEGGKIDENKKKGKAVCGPRSKSNTRGIIKFLFKHSLRAPFTSSQEISFVFAGFHCCWHSSMKHDDDFSIISPFVHTSWCLIEMFFARWLDGSLVPEKGGESWRWEEKNSPNALGSFEFWLAFFLFIDFSSFSSLLFLVDFKKN